MTVNTKVLGLAPTLYSLNVASRTAPKKKKKNNLVKQGVDTIVGVSLAKEMAEFIEST